MATYCHWILDIAAILELYEAALILTVIILILFEILQIYRTYTWLLKVYPHDIPLCTFQQSVWKKFLSVSPSNFCTAILTILSSQTY
jgi:hypothetical protein